MYTIIQGNLLPAMPIEIFDNGVPFTFVVGDVVSLVWRAPDGTVTRSTLVLVDDELLEMRWAAGDTAKVGTYTGQVTVERVGEDAPRTYPNDGTRLVWRVYRALHP